MAIARNSGVFKMIMGQGMMLDSSVCYRLVGALLCAHHGLILSVYA